jgi:transcriptional regulator with XRE-family HTH domain
MTEKHDNNRIEVPLRRFRRERGISGAELAALAGCSPSTVSVGERGYLTQAMAVRFATILGVDPSDLLPATSSDQ